MLAADSQQAWSRVLAGLAYARRGVMLAACSGVLVLFLGAVSRAGCANPSLPEVRSLMEYQDVLFYLALYLGLVMVVGGQWWTALQPGTWSERAVPLGMGALSAVALGILALVASPGHLPQVNAPPGDSAALIGAVVGTAALAGTAMVAMQIARQLGDDRLVRSAALFGLALLAAAAANGEAASGLLFPGPVTGLYVVGAVAVIDAATCFWLSRLLRRSEALVRGHLAQAPPGRD